MMGKQDALVVVRDDPTRSGDVSGQTIPIEAIRVIDHELGHSINELDFIWILDAIAIEKFEQCLPVHSPCFLRGCAAGTIAAIFTGLLALK